jgi:hypothetical protein
MAKGELLRDVRFPRDVRAQLAALLASYDAAAIIRQLEDLAAFVPAFAAPALDATRETLAARRRAVRACLRTFAWHDGASDALLDSELVRRGAASNTLATLWERLAEIDAALRAITVPHRRGRRADAQARWLIERTAHVLGAAGAPVSRYEDGIFAQTLRILWPVVLRREAPIELRPWFKSLKLRR